MQCPRRGYPSERIVMYLRKIFAAAILALLATQGLTSCAATNIEYIEGTVEDHLTEKMWNYTLYTFELKLDDGTSRTVTCHTTHASGCGLIDDGEYVQFKLGQPANYSTDGVTVLEVISTTPFGDPRPASITTP